MKRLPPALAAALVLLAALAGTARAGDVIWPSNQNANGFVVKNQGAPTTDGNSLRLGDMPGVGPPCALVYTGTLGALFRCATPADIPGVTGTPNTIAWFNGSGILNSLTLAPEFTLTTGTLSIAAGGVTTVKLADAAVTYAKIQNVGAGKLLGNPTGSPAPPSEIAPDGTSIGFAGTTLQRQAITGAVTAAAGSGTTVFGTASPLSALVNATNGSAVPSFVGPAGANQALMGTPAGTGVAWQTVPGASVRADGIATGTIQLASLAAAPLADGTIAYVDSVGDFFKLVQAALTTTSTTVITASGKSGYQWHRMNVPNPSWQARSAWFVDGQNASGHASDENDGAGTGTPLLTPTELSYRVAGSVYSGSVTYTIMSDLNAADHPFMDVETVGTGRITLVGTPTVIYTGTVTSYTAQSATAAADDCRMQDSTIPVSFTASGLTAAGLIYSDGTSWWWPAKDLGAKTIRTSVPANTAGSLQGTPSGAYTVQRLPKIFGFRWADRSMSRVFYQLVNESTTAAAPGPPMNQRWDRCAFTTNATIVGGLFSNTEWSAGGSLSAGVNYSYSHTFGLFIGDGTTTQYQGRDYGTITFPTFQGAGWYTLDRGSVRYVNSRVSHYDFAGELQKVANGSSSDFVGTATLGGSGNSSYLFRVEQPGSKIRYETVPVAVSSSSSASPQVYVDGATYALTDLPVVNVSADNGVYAVAATAVLKQVGGQAGFSALSAGGYMKAAPSTAFWSVQATVPWSDVSGSPTFLGDPGSSGIVVRTAPGTTINRSLTNTDGTLTITNPDGVAGNPIINTTGLTPSTRTVTGTAPISIAGDHAAHDLGTNRTWALDTNGVTYPFLQQGAALSIPGRAANSIGNWADIAAAAGSGGVFRESGSTLGFGSITEAIVANLVTDLAGKQPVGNYISGLNGDGAATGPGLAALTLASIITPGSCTNCNLTWDGKGRVTIATTGSSGGGGTVTGVSGLSPIFSSGGTAPQISIQGALVSGATSTTAQNLGLLSTGIPKLTVSGGVATFSIAAAGSDYVHSLLAQSPISNSGTSADPIVSILDFVASGGSASRGAVPNPGAIAGTGRCLREDATWHTCVQTLGVTGALFNGGTAADPVIGLSLTGVTAGTYVIGNGFFTVGADGRLTNAAGATAYTSSSVNGGGAVAGSQLNFVGPFSESLSGGIATITLAIPPQATTTFVFAYGAGSYGVNLPSGGLGHSPDFWFRPMSYTASAGEEFAAFGQVWEYNAGDSFGNADLFAYVYQCGISITGGSQDDLVFEVTKNGVRTGRKVTVSCPNTTQVNTQYSTFGALSVTSTDRVGVEVYDSATGVYSSGALRATVTLRLRP